MFSNGLLNRVSPMPASAAFDGLERPLGRIKERQPGGRERRNSRGQRWTQEARRPPIC